jgi:hypothetical protein
MDVQNAFKTKTKVKFYVPEAMEFDKVHSYSIELMDLINAYIEPLKYGIAKEDILEFLTDSLYEKMDLFSFLRYRRFLALEEDFDALFLKYLKPQEFDGAKSIRGYEVVLEDIKPSEEETLDLRIMNTLNHLEKLGATGYKEPGCEVKEVYYNIKAKKFAYIKSI